MLTTDLNNLKYAAVEVIKSPGTKLADVECGAFMGVITYENEAGEPTQLMVLQNAPNSVRFYNTLEYGIMTIQAQSAEMRYMTVFTKNDQEEAISILKQIVAAMKEQRRLYSLAPGNELINVDTYTLMPDIVLTGNNLSSSVTDRTSATTGFGNRQTNPVNHTYASGYTPYVAPEKPVVLNFKRKGKLPGEERIACMRNLVIALAEKTTTLKIPIPKCDMPKEEVVADTTLEVHPPGEQTVVV